MSDERSMHFADGGPAGASAQAEFERRRAKHEGRVRSRHPVLGGLILAVNGEPQHVTAWAKGARGERAVGRRLQELAGQHVVTLNDRFPPGAAWNIDHIAVAPSGVFVIDAKRYEGAVTTKATGTMLRPGPRKLVVGRRDCTRLVDGMARQVAAVIGALHDVQPTPPVTPMITFVDAQWPLFAKPLSIQDVWVGWPKAMAAVVARPGPLTPEQIFEIARRLDERLPAPRGSSRTM